MTMTDTTTDTTPDLVVTPDPSEVLAESLFGAALGLAELTNVHFGRELGLYAALRAAGPSTPGGLAALAGIDARYAQEWLEQQAMAGVLTHDSGTFTLPEAHAPVLLDEEHPAYSGALAGIVPVVARVLDAVIDAFRTGAGVPFSAYGVHDMQAGFTRPMFASDLVSTWIPALPDIHSRLVAGEPLRIADLGCGEGWAAIYLAEAYPNVTVHGIDVDERSIDAARRHATERGVDDRVVYSRRDVRSLQEGFDLVMACEVVHDVADPVGMLAAMRDLAGESGAILVIDENAAETFEPNGDPIQRLLYGFSTLHCLPAGRTEPGSAATGTVMRPATFRAYAGRAGLDVTVLPIDNPVFRFYRLART